MPEYTALELARDVSPAVSPRLIDHALNVFSRAALSLVLAFGGLVVATSLLLVGVVGAPVIAFALTALALRRRHAASARVFATPG